MSIRTKTQLVIEHSYDPVRCRQMLNDTTYVLHCHHYLSLYTQLADDIGMLDGKALLADVTEDTFYERLKRYYAKNGICSVRDRISIAEQLYAEAGLGKMKITCAGRDSGEVSLIRSHVDEGWIKKFGKRDKPVNFVTQGYIAGAFAAVFDLPTRSYRVNETASIVSGAEKSTFMVVRN